MFLYKKCEVCGEKINKLQKLRNIYTLKMGEVLRCKYCFTYYKTNKIVESFSSIYINTGIGIIFWFIAGICFAILLPTTINQNVKFIVALLFSFIFLSFINFIIACVIPLHKTQPPQKIHKQSFIYYWVAMGILAIILIAFFVGFLGIKF
ncbi:hypothetical protein [Helicobacter japonicus]|uniref:ATRX ADD domain-containing protein n=1 Tax=Helicobacter japonicus TaxID=425400 RepID=A0A4U8THX2_9HELI|nr:hypothetical protein [Helicobacter japonicus]TLD98347.1 hypothetical protein LS65_009710 [Helicobacter japonicus]